MKYFRIHTMDIAWITKQPRGIFTTIGKMAEDGTLTEKETAEYWDNREYFEEVLPVPPFYKDGNPEGAITWFKDTPEGNRIWEEMTFHRAIAAKYGLKFYMSECNEAPGEILYEDEFQIAVKGMKPDVEIVTRLLDLNQ
ncbi:MAG: hypothetical protein IK125_06520 [Lachnospiraceae bacterium]|nr:hypothetical protein [Lachnospiraceae bacterium]